MTVPSPTDADDASDRITDVLLMLRVGEVVTYRDVAVTAGFPNHARFVGRILARTAVEVPWWRVVTASGRLVPGAEATQAELLRREGVCIDGGRVQTAPSGRFAGRPRLPNDVSGVRRR